MMDFLIFGTSMWDAIVSSHGWTLLTKYGMQFPVATAYTLGLTIISVFFGMILGLVAGMAKISRFRMVNWAAYLYVDFFRGTPLLVQIMLLYFGVLPLIGIDDAFIGGVVALSLNCGAYTAEIVRAGIQAIDKGQTEAAYSLGMDPGQTMRHVILPQAYKIMIPPFINEFVAILKDTSLVYTIGVTELAMTTKLIVAKTYAPAWGWGLASLIYLIMTKVFASLGDYLERRFKTE